MNHTISTPHTGSFDDRKDGVPLAMVDLVHGLEVQDVHPDNTLLTLSNYIYALGLPLRQHTMALAIVRHVNWDTGDGCYAGLETLARESRLNEREASRAIKALVDLGIIGRKRTLRGNSKTWLILPSESENPIPAVFGGNVQDTGGGNVQDTGGEVNQSVFFNQSKKPKDSQIEDSKVVGRKRKPQERGAGDASSKATVIDTPTPTNSAPAAARQQEWPEPVTVAERPQPFDPLNNPDKPPISFMAGYCQVMLRRYAKTWLTVWDMDIEKVIRYYATRWPKFLKDLQHHRANELANVPYADGLRAAEGLEAAIIPVAKVDAVRCLDCGTYTLHPKDLINYRGERVADGCHDCHRPALVAA